jgi:hypothetical protein
MSNDVEIVITSKDQASAGLKAAGKEAETTKDHFEDLDAKAGKLEKSGRGLHDAITGTTDAMAAGGAIMRGDFSPATFLTAAGALADLGGAFGDLLLPLAKTVATTVAHTAAVAAHAVVIGVVRAATVTWTAIQWALNVALSANPIGLVVAAILILVGIIVLVATKTTWFQTIWKAVWSFMKGVGHWFAHDFVGFFRQAWEWIKGHTVAFVLFIHGKIQSFIAFFTGIPAKITAIGKHMWEGLVGTFKAAINTIIRGWNAVDFGIHVHLPSWLGGFGFDINDVVPDIPYLAKGGRVTRAGRAVVGERGAEVVDLPAGATVHPSGSTGGVEMTFAGDLDTAFASAFMNLVRTGKIKIAARAVV